MNSWENDSNSRALCLNDDHDIMKDTLEISSCTCKISHHYQYTDGTESHSRHYTALSSSSFESKSVIKPSSTTTAR